MEKDPRLTDGRVAGPYCTILGDGLPHPARVGGGTQAQVRRMEGEFLMAFQPRRPLVGLLQ